MTRCGRWRRRGARANARDATRRDATRMQLTLPRQMQLMHALISRPASLAAPLAFFKSRWFTVRNGTAAAELYSARDLAPDPGGDLNRSGDLAAISPIVQRDERWCSDHVRCQRQSVPLFVRFSHTPDLALYFIPPDPSDKPRRLEHCFWGPPPWAHGLFAK